MLEEDEKYFESKRFKNLLRRYETAMQQSGTVYMESDELTDVAEYYAMSGRMDEANQVIELALALHPGSVDPQVFLSRQQMFLGNIAKAYELADAIPDQEDREVLFLRAELLLSDEKKAEAHAYLMDLYHTLCADDEPDYFLYDAAALLYDYNAWQETLDVLNLLRQQYAPMPKAERLYIYTLMETMHYPEVAHTAEAYLDNHPYDTAVWVLKGEAEAAMEHLEAAREAADYALAIEPENPRALVLAGNCCFHLGLHEEAQGFFQTYLSKYPEEDSALYLSSLCLSALEKHQEALEQLKKINMASPTVEEMREGILLHRAMTEAQLGNLQEALSFENLYELEATHMEKNGDMLRGFIYLYCGQVAQAVQLLRSGLTADIPLEVAFDAPIQLLERNLVEEAIELLLLMDELYATDAERERIAPMLAHCYYQKGDQPAFLHTFLRALQHEPELTAKVFHLQLPRTADAQELFRSACLQLMRRGGSDADADNTRQA